MRHAIGIALVSLFAAGCAGVQGVGTVATAKLAPASGSSVTGTVEFAHRGNMTILTAKVSGLTPGPHGFHIHEKGDCSAPDAMSAGGHFNPGGKKHGSPLVPDHHAGDLPMLAADAAGQATLTTQIEGVTIGDGGPNDIVGRSVVIHKDADDYSSQPAGNSGARVACGVIAKS